MINNTIKSALSRSRILFMVVELNLADEYGVFAPDTDVTAINHFLGKLLKIVNQVIFFAFRLGCFCPIEAIQQII